MPVKNRGGKTQISPSTVPGVEAVEFCSVRWSLAWTQRCQPCPAFCQKHQNTMSCAARPVLCGRVPPTRHSKKNPARREARRIFLIQPGLDQEAAARGARLRELRWKNRAWLATAETIAGWNGFEIRNAGSGRSPVRKRSG